MQFGAIKHPDTAVRWVIHIIHVSGSKKGETINTLTYLKVNNGLDMAVKTQKTKEHVLISYAFSGLIIKTAAFVIKALTNIFSTGCVFHVACLRLVRAGHFLLDFI